MAPKVRGYDEIKLYKIAKLNLRGKVKDWFKKLQLALLIDWNEMKIGMQQKLNDVEVDELGMKMDVVQQEPQH